MSALTELEPASISENKEVNVSIQNFSTRDKLSNLSIDLSVTPMHFTPNQLIDPDQDHPAAADIADYNSLVSMVRDYPTDMFINYLIIKYSNSDSNLERIRVMLFKMLTNSDDFPFKVDSELKRSANTRQRESVA